MDKKGKKKTKQEVKKKSRKRERRKGNSTIKLYFTKKNTVTTKVMKSSPVII